MSNVPIVEQLFFKNVDKLQYKGELPILPHWYLSKEFENDILGMFQGVEKRLGRYNLDIIKKRQFKSTFHSIRMDEWAAIQRFFVTFPKTNTFQTILQYHAPHDAAKWFIRFLAAKNQISREEDGSNDIRSLLSHIMRESKRDNIDIPFVTGGGESGDGHYSIKFLKKKIKIADILKNLIVKYRGASKNSTLRLKSDLPADELEPRMIKSFDEISQVFSNQLTLPEDLFLQKLVTKQLQVPQWYAIKTHPKKYIMLLDVSGSMKSFDRYIYATASAIALIKNAKRSGVNEAVVIPFDGSTHTAIEGNTDKCIDTLLNIPFSGGGTEIDVALKEADALSPDEIILITDGVDSVYYKPKTKLYTVFCGSDSNEMLENISYSFERIGE